MNYDFLNNETEEERIKRRLTFEPIEFQPLIVPEALEEEVFSQRIADHMESLSFFERIALTQSARSGDLEAEYPNSSFTADDILNYSYMNYSDFSSQIGISSGEAEIKAEEIKKDVYDTFTNVKYVLYGFIILTAYKAFKK